MLHPALCPWTTYWYSFSQSLLPDFDTASAQEAQREIEQYTLIIVVDARLPVANFGYSGGPSALLPAAHLDNSKIWEFDCDALGVKRPSRGISETSVQGAGVAPLPQASSPSVQGAGVAQATSPSHHCHWPELALRLLALQVGASSEAVKPNVNCGGVFCSASRPSVPTGKGFLNE